MTKDPVYENVNEFKNKIAELNERADKTKESRMTCQVKFNQLEENETKLIEKIKNIGYDPDTMKGTIVEMQNELTAIVNKVDKILPDKDGNIPEDYVTNLHSNVQELEVKYVNLEIPENLIVGTISSTIPIDDDLDGMEL